MNKEIEKKIYQVEIDFYLNAAEKTEKRKIILKVFVTIKQQ